MKLQTLIFENLLTESRISWIYKPAKDLHKQAVDFHILSLIYRFNQGKKSKYYSSTKTNQELDFILNDAIKKIVNSQRKILTQILSSIIAIELARLGQDNPLFKKLQNPEFIYLNPNYYKNVSGLIKKFNLGPNEISEFGQDHSDFAIKELAGSLNALTKSKKLDDGIIAIINVYDVINSRKENIDKFPSKYWLNFEELRNKDAIWKIFRSSSIPQRIIGYLVKHKGFENREEIFNKTTMNKRDLENIKSVSYKFLFKYLTDTQKFIKSSLLKYKVFSDLDPREIKLAINDEAIEAISKDSVYNNKRIKERKDPKKSFDIDSSKLNPFNPFRYYEYRDRTELAIKLDNGSQYKKILIDFIDIEDKQVPYAVFINLGPTFGLKLKEFIDGNNLTLPPETKIGELEEFEFES